MKQSLGLLENAADSFNEAIRKVRDARYGDARPYKFAVLHFTHAIELLFKHHVALAHPLLIYRNPFSKALDKEATIGLWEAVQFFKNEQKELTAETLDDLKWIKSLRNNIEHYKFEMDLREARRTIGRLIRALNEFHEANGLTDLATLIEADCRDTYEKLADEYKQELFEAQQAAAAASSDHEPQNCFLCGGQRTMVQSANSLECHLCGNESLLHECLRCGNTLPDEFMRLWNDEHGPGEEEYMCDYCHDALYEDADRD